MAAVLCFPAAAAGYSTNEASVEVDGEGNGVAVCQLLIVGRSVLVLDIEDPLSLATLPSSDALPLPMIMANDVAPSQSACEIDVGQITAAGGQGSLVTGGALVGEPGAEFPAGAAAVSAWEASEVALCQRIVFVDMVIVGGTAAGLPAGRATEPIQFHREIQGSELASCMVQVGFLKVHNS